MDFLFAVQVSVYEWHTFHFHGIQQFIYHIINNGNGFFWFFIGHNMVIRFAFFKSKEGSMIQTYYKTELFAVWLKVFIY